MLPNRSQQQRAIHMAGCYGRASRVVLASLANDERVGTLVACEATSMACVVGVVSKAGLIDVRRKWSGDEQ